MRYIHFVLTVAIGLVCASVNADDYYEWMARLKAADVRCNEARAAKLAPIREQLVQECVKEGRRSLSVCQNDMRDYGESTRNRRGTVIRGLFYDLPECQAAEREWEAWWALQRQKQ